MTAHRMGTVFRQVDLLLRDGTMSGLTDRELIERFRERGQRSESAFAVLVERHGPMVLGVCRSILGDPDDVDDAFQATFLILVRRAGMLWVRDSIGPWLHGVAGRVALRARTDAHRRRIHEERASHREDDPHPAGRGAHDPAPERSEAVRLIHEELIQLPERWRAPLVLCHLEGLTHEQASRSLGVPVGTIRSRLSRGRERLKDRLIRRGLAPSLAGLISSGIGLGGEGSAAVISASLVHKTVSAAVGVVSGWSMAGVISVSTFQLTQGVLMTMFLAKAKTAAMILVIGGGTMLATMKAGGVGIADPAAADANAELVAIQGAKPDPAPTRSSPEAPREGDAPGDPASRAELLPTPSEGDAAGKPGTWPTIPDVRGPQKSTVRISTLEAGKFVPYGSGTIISSTPDESIILTRGPIHWMVAPTQKRAKSLESGYPVEVEVIEELDPKKMKPVEHLKLSALLGIVIICDEERGLALIRIHPGRQLPASPVVPAGWDPKLKLQMLSIGRDKSGSPTGLTTKITSLKDKFPAREVAFKTICCDRAPKDARGGEGLFTDYGYLAGIFWLEEPSGTGLYTHPATIHDFLDHNGLKSLYAAATDGETKKKPAEDPLKSAEPSVEQKPVAEKVPPVAPPMPTTPAVPPVDRARGPLLSTVQIQITGVRNTKYATGTVISSTPKELIILTCGQIFKLDGIPQPVPSKFPKQTLVNLFEEELPGHSISKGPPNLRFRVGMEGDVIDYDFESDLGLIRISPERRQQPPASPIVPPSWKGKDQMHVLAVGCNPGYSPPTVGPAKLLGPDVHIQSGKFAVEGILGTSQRVGKMGGGLFTDDGHLLGVGNPAGPSDNSWTYGTYSTPASIHAFLDRNGLKKLYAITADGDAKKAPAEDLPKALEDLPKAPEPSVERKPIADPAIPKDEPALGTQEPPNVIKTKPWETSVRIRILGEGNVGFGSGTVISSTAEESIILTCAHIFKMDLAKQVEPHLFPKIQVDLFDGILKGTKPAHVTFLETHEGTFIDSDLKRDVALVRIKTGRRLPASPIVPPRWKPAQYMQMMTAGCSEGRDATVWSTKVLNPRVRGLSENPEYEAIECDIAPVQGRSGGGLFTDDGYLAGVSNFSDHKANRGLYAIPNSIYQILDRNGLDHLHRTLPFEQLDPSARGIARSLESKRSAEELKNLFDAIQRRRKDLDASKQRLDELGLDVAKRLVEAEGREKKQQTDPGSAELPAPATTRPNPPNVEDRLKEVEQKLERMLKLLEKKSDTPPPRYGL